MHVMSLKEILTEKEPEILDRWLERALEVYPADSRNFFRESRDPFSNPIGSTLREGMKEMYNQVIDPENERPRRPSLEGIVRIRALEESSPPRAVSFIPLLKEIIVEIIAEELKGQFSSPEWIAMSEEIGRFTIEALEIHAECRERIDWLKMKERKRRTGHIQGDVE